MGRFRDQLISGFSQPRRQRLIESPSASAGGYFALFLTGFVHALWNLGR